MMTIRQHHAELRTYLQEPAGGARFAGFVGTVVPLLFHGVVLGQALTVVEVVQEGVPRAVQACRRGLKRC